MNKYQTTKNYENADLIAVFQHCPFEEATNDCPFITFHQLNDVEEQISLLNTLSDETLRNLRAFHRLCIILRRNQMELNEVN